MSKYPNKMVLGTTSDGRCSMLDLVRSICVLVPLGTGSLKSLNHMLLTTLAELTRTIY